MSGYDGPEGAWQLLERAAGMVLSRFEFLIGLGVGGTFAYQVWERTTTGGHPNDRTPLLQLMALGGALALVLAYRVGAASLRLRPRLLVNTGAVLYIVFGLFWPLKRQVEADAPRRQAERLRQEAQTKSAHSRQEEWREGLIAGGAHGTEGVVPPMLEVQEDGDQAYVTNRSTRVLRIALARVKADARAPGGYRGCAMRAVEPSGSLRDYFKRIEPGDGVLYFPDLDCRVAFRGAAIEYRVGRGSEDGEGWWSDSAFAAPEGRERDGRAGAAAAR